MYIRLLGPLEVLTVEGAPIALSTPRLRSLLALLALQPGRSVEADVLADQLWGGEVPPTARATVRTYVMRLRKALPPGSLGTGPEGYRLELEETGTDIGRLRELLRRARGLAATDPDGALALLDEAVRLRRGTPLTGREQRAALVRLARWWLGTLHALNRVLVGKLSLRAHTKPSVGPRGAPGPPGLPATADAVVPHSAGRAYQPRGTCVAGGGALPSPSVSVPRSPGLRAARHRAPGWFAGFGPHSALPRVPSSAVANRPAVRAGRPLPLLRPP
ncbi:SARP family transcriptional regulator [Streptomyces sp. GBA 94-10 4N24]|uniref:AfsR/SARP family transcriptional regulator n=1 Tax=Streptomyces TaxID=1883 RepID=UPI0003C2FB82|nr:MULTISPECIES: winged helix-turn-helix domain-containing protein [Streptomyces]ESP99619.1 SARP family transcriptional regulator [Streptomyces sp. GBA 94-10 4N24]ESQ05677.1 SARP family transcriptional regulator [Streptomyces sp. PVA_94-07]RWZ75932.1 hypothetical protein EQK42_11150 [Streptomyces albidoflavus]UZN58578.1 SARP family transcriptional regulator [Streptomyces sp. GBA 94-10 4N24]